MKPIFAVLIIILVSSTLISGQSNNALAKSDENSHAHERVRVVADSEQKARAAVDSGCETVRETRGLKALLCTPEVASSLELKADIRVFKSDMGANSQIGANTVQNTGNQGQGRKIVVLDTGYNYNHPELSSSYLGGRNFINNSTDPMDDNGHGSHVAGLITADGLRWNAKGVAPKAGIIVGKVLDINGAGFLTDIIAGVYWAVDGPDDIAGTPDDFRADAINLSIGTGPPYLYKTHCNGVNPDMTAAIKYAVSRGVVVVVAAGNYGSAGVSLPGCISYALTVGAVNKFDNIASFSGRGGPVDIVAPGVDLLSSWLGTSYATSSGTSMATPVVSGTIALIKHDHRWYSAYKVQNVLTSTALDLGKEGRDWAYGYGRVVAPAAVG